MSASSVASGETGWIVLDAAPDLLENDVHVWRAPLVVGDERLQQLRAHLSRDESQRVDRLKVPFRRREAIVSRGTLREVLSAYLGPEPPTFAFEFGAQGKPSLAGPSVGFEFNLAHAHEWLLVAVTLDRAVGVDVEKVRADIAFEQMAERYYSEPERAALLALDESRRADAFFRAWTLKEALLKARSTGFAVRLADFDVTVDPGAPAALFASRDEALAPGDWSLVDLHPAEGYRGAVAVAGGAPDVSCFVAGTVGS